MRQHIRVLIGKYASTRVVEQIASEYSTCIWNPEDIDALLLERKKDFIGKFKPNPKPWLIIFKIDGDNAPENNVERLPVRWWKIQVNGRHWGMDLLFLDANARWRWNLRERVQFDELMFFRSICPQYQSVMLRQYTKDLSMRAEEEFMCRLKTIPFGQCITLNGGGVMPLWKPWQKHWTPESHSTFPPSVRERVRLLLLAQRDAGSLLSRLDKACLMEILRYGAALDGPLIVQAD